MLVVWAEVPALAQFRYADVQYLANTVPRDIAVTTALAIDPGETCGWASLGWSDGARHGVQVLRIGDCSSYALVRRLSPSVGRLIVEYPPRARAMEPWPWFSTGAIMHAVWPRDIVWQSPGDMAAPKRWARITTRGVSQHAKDAFSHLLSFVVADTLIQ